MVVGLCKPEDGAGADSHHYLLNFSYKLVEAQWTGEAWLSLLDANQQEQKLVSARDAYKLGYRYSHPI